ncbi:MAG: hypothetical protein ACREBD_29335 [Blastocatellia bacterium]
MDFYLIIVPALVLSLCMIINLLVLKRRDERQFAEHERDSRKMPGRKMKTDRL